MRPVFLTGAALGLLLAPTPSLAAREVTYGAQVGVALPAGPARQEGFKSGGPSLGFHALVDLGGGHALRPRIEWTHNRRECTEALGAGAAPRTRVAGTARTLSLGADYLFHPQGRTEGL
ncbi:MAG TPA: hypothetical protein VK188_13245 [Holophaga sp.]|nr:hypothetical protein [Holophaga sp.]